MVYLLDANVLIALGDVNHPHHAIGMRFMKNLATSDAWATCPLTENAFLRVLGRRQIEGTTTTPNSIRANLLLLLKQPRHQFWPDDLSLSDTTFFPRLPSALELTDLYLLGLAAKHGGVLATFDRRINPTLVSGGAQALHVLAGE